MELKLKYFKKNQGFTLMEILIVVTSLGLLSVVGSNLLFNSMFGSSKSETLKETKQNGEYALKVMEETIKNAFGYVSCFTNQSVTVKDKNSVQTTFSFQLDQSHDNIGRIASNSSFLTNDKVSVSNFSLSCEQTPGVPLKVNISFSVSQAETTDRPERKAKYDFKSSVTMRNY